MSVPPCDHLLLVATSSELAALSVVGRELGLTCTRRRDPDLGRFLRLDRQGGTLAIVVKTEMGALGTNGSVVTAWRFQAACEAAFVIQVGTAFGVSPDEQHIGDVLVARSLLAYDNRNIGTHEDHERVTYPRVSPIAASLDVVHRCEEFARVWEATRPAYSVRFGALLSGGAAISRAAFRHQLWNDLTARSNHPIVGGEMEAIGLVGVGRAPGARWGVIKAISDFADEDRDAHIRQSRVLASENAARFALGTLLAANTENG